MFIRSQTVGHTLFVNCAMEILFVIMILIDVRRLFIYG